MTVVTGETGAGKSLLVDALLLLAGGRADAERQVRHGCERAELRRRLIFATAPDLGRLALGPRSSTRTAHASCAA